MILGWSLLEPLNRVVKVVRCWRLQSGSRPFSMERSRTGHRRSANGARLRQFGLQNGLFAAKELAALSDGAGLCICRACEKAFPGQEVTFILDLSASSNMRTPP